MDDPEDDLDDYPGYDAGPDDAEATLALLCWVVALACWPQDADEHQRSVDYWLEHGELSRDCRRRLAEQLDTMRRWQRKAEAIRAAGKVGAAACLLASAALLLWWWLSVRGG